MKTATILGVLGGLITLIIGAAAYANMQYMLYAPFFTLGSFALGGAVVGILSIIFAWMIHKHMAMPVLLLIFSLIGLAIGGGVVIGPILALVASLMSFKAPKAKK
jgi:hypothetical protein